MRIVSLIAAVALTLAVAGQSEGQGKKKLPALAHDATFVKFDVSKKGNTPTKVYYQISEADAKKIGVKSGNHPVTRNTKFVFVGTDGEKSFTQKNVLGSEEGKTHLVKDGMIRVQVTGIEAEEIRFGPGLKPEGVKRVR